MEADRFRKDIFRVNKHNFNELALEIFHFQVKTNKVYAQFVKELGLKPESIQQLEDIPHLPISFFKSKKVVSISDDNRASQQIFESSSTSGTETSKHHIFNLDFYLKVARTGFEHQYGPLGDYCFLALLPGYLERQNSSLVYMAKHFIEKSRYHQSGFFLDDFEGLSKTLENNKQKGVPTILLGVSFALLDFAEKYSVNFADLIVMDTGGMKGRRKEMVRDELHQGLKTSFGVESIHSEYGMTELMSQAYSQGEGRFTLAPWMRVSTRETSDPFHQLDAGKTGGLNIIDLANIDSCCFIATSDLGKCYADGSFEVLGRFDHSDIRGCNLLYS
jgi:phenylacetate-coenzyme A ligase PaaK-like adenylate-forming protein